MLRLADSTAQGIDNAAPFARVNLYCLRFAKAIAAVVPAIAW